MLCYSPAVYLLSTYDLKFEKQILVVVKKIIELKIKFNQFFQFSIVNTESIIFLCK